jgi:hypothetical protein
MELSLKIANTFLKIMLFHFTLEEIISTPNSEDGTLKPFKRVKNYRCLKVKYILKMGQASLTLLDRIQLITEPRFKLINIRLLRNINLTQAFNIFTWMIMFGLYSVPLSPIHHQVPALLHQTANAFSISHVLKWTRNLKLAFQQFSEVKM